MTWLALDAEIAAEFDEFTTRDTVMLTTLERRWCRPVWTRSPIACRTCGAAFVPLRATTVFCSTLCKGRYHKERSHRRWQDKVTATRLAARSGRVCANPRCRAVFNGRRFDSMYCTGACRDRFRALRYQRRKAAARHA